MVIRPCPALTKLMKEAIAYMPPVKDEKFLRSDAYPFYSLAGEIYNSSFPLWRELREELFEYFQTYNPSPNKLRSVSKFKLIRTTGRTVHIPTNSRMSLIIQLKGKGSLVLKETKEWWTLMPANGIEEMDIFDYGSRKWTRVKLDLHNGFRVGNKFSHVYIPEGVGGVIAYVQFN